MKDKDNRLSLQNRLIITFVVFYGAFNLLDGFAVGLIAFLLALAVFLLLPILQSYAIPEKSRYFKKQSPNVAISDAEVDEVLRYLNSLPYSKTARMPDVWAKQQFIDWLNESLPNEIEHGVHFEIATGVSGKIVQLSSISMSSDKIVSNDDRYLVMLYTRPTKTDLNDLVDIT